MFLLRLAILNLKRNPTRSIVTILAIVLGVAGLVFLYGFRDGVISQMENNATQLFTGHVQIHGKGFLDSYSPGIVVPELQKVEASLKSQHDVIAYTKRIRAQSLISMNDISHVVQLIGIDPSQEQLVTCLSAHIEQGRFLDPSASHELVIGDSLSSRLKLKIGDRPAVVTRGVYGTDVGMIGTVVGIYHTGTTKLDEMVAYTSLSDASKLLDLEGQCQEIAIKLKNPSSITNCVHSLRQSINDNDCEILPWYEIMPELRMWERFYQFSIDIMVIAVTMVIAVMIMNVVLMSVLDRIRELGVMLAIGTSPKQLGCLVLLETLFLESCGIIIGVCVGLLLLIYFGEVGIKFEGIEKNMAAYCMSPTVYPIITLGSVLSAVFTIICISTITSIYPIVKAARLQPVKAIYRS